MDATTFVRAFRKLVAPLERRVKLMVNRAVVNLVDDSQNLQILQVGLRADELLDDVERFGQYGFTSNPPANSEAVVVAVGGALDHPIAVAVEDRNTRPTDLAEGESCLYTAQNGKRVYNKADGSIELGTSPTDFAALKTPTRANDDALKNSIAQLRSAIAGWTPVPNDGGAALKAALATWLSATETMQDVGATEVKAK